MSGRRCTTVKPARCVVNGRRATVHACTRFPKHVAWHRCECGHVWPNTPTSTPNSSNGGRGRTDGRNPS